jgi:hypothetical protein
MASPTPSHRACVRCQEVRPIEMFEMGPSGKRRRGVCTTCAEAEGYRLDRRPRNGKPGGGQRRTFTKDGRRYRTCRRCERTLRLTAQSFHRHHTTYKDGTPMYGYLCKPCARAEVSRRYEQGKRDPEASARRRAQAREAQRRYARRHVERVKAQRKAAVERLRANPAKYAAFLERRRMERRLRRERTGRSLVTRNGALRGPVTMPSGPRVLPAKPLAVAIARAVIRHQDTVEAICESIGTDARSYTAWRSEREGVQVDVADRVITGLGLLWFDVYDEDVWPDAHEQAEAVFG